MCQTSLCQYRKSVESTKKINGVQKLASAVISPTKRKIGEAIFVWLFLLLDAGQLFHNLFP
ncbi:hydrolase [Enterococcus faecium]|nr:hydrolase [Enterococcus faecium]